MARTVGAGPAASSRGPCSRAVEEVLSRDGAGAPDDDGDDADGDRETGLCCAGSAGKKPLESTK